MKTVLNFTLLAIPLLLTSNAINAQTDFKISFTNSEELYINDLLFDEKINVEKLQEVFGKPSKTVSYIGGEISHFYEDAGVVFFTKDSSVLGVGINFNWDGDKKFPEKSFTGKLTLGGIEITKDTKRENITSIESIKFDCPIDILCASISEKSMVAFEEDRLTQMIISPNYKP